jgi:hypothetical protein
VQVQERQDFTPGAMRQPTGNEKVHSPCSHRRVAYAPHRIRYAVREYDEQHDDRHDGDPKQNAWPYKGFRTWKTDFHAD